MAALHRERYTVRSDGTQLPQTSRPELIAEMLGLLDVLEGNHVLEAGTGSGYSTALLSKLVGDHGSVVSLDIDEEMVDRAARLLREDGLENVRVLLGDGRAGYPPGAPYDRLVAWASSQAGVPPSWLEQVVADGLIVAPFPDR
jgi:protein-L-isoaspartate(D-aspartate) O-methyltransferase